MKRLSYRDDLEYRFGHRAEPRRLRVPLGTSNVCETEDSFVGQMYDEHARPMTQFVPQMGRGPVELNPVTGPILVKEYMLAMSLSSILTSAARQQRFHLRRTHDRAAGEER